MFSALTDTTASLFDAFMNFPMPVVMTDGDGRPQLVNTLFSTQFDGRAIDPASLSPREAPQEVNLRCTAGTGSEVRKRVASLRTPQCMLLVFIDDLPDSSNTSLALLQHRVSMLERVAATDHLTSAWNRAHFDRVIDIEIDRSQTTRHPLSLILLDIDHFKDVNDRHGHATGDIVLRELAERLRARLRASDVLFRWGGEEFAVLVSSAGYRSASIVAEALRLAVAEQPFQGAGQITISLGVAEHISEETAKDWFSRLDAALYGAKAAGRNRVITDHRGDSDTWAADSRTAAPHLIWHEGYGCGNAVIDDGHRELFSLANELIEAAVTADEEPAPYGAALDRLLEHVAQHFHEEEALLASLNYAQFAQHRRAHQGLLRRAAALKTRIENHQAGFGSLVEFLCQDVVARHMLTVDRAFYPLFTQAQHQ